MSAQLVVFCKHRLFRVSKFDFLVIQPASVKFPMNILMLFHDFRNIGRPSDFPGFGCQRPTTKLVRFIAERCTLQTESSWDQHLPKNYAQSNCLAPLLDFETVVAVNCCFLQQSWVNLGKLMLETTSVFAGSPRQSSATSKWWSASFNSTTQPWHSCQFGFMTHHPKNSVMPFWLKHLQPTSWGADMCNRLPVVLSIDNLRHEPKKSRSRV